MTQTIFYHKINWKTFTTWKPSIVTRNLVLQRFLRCRGSWTKSFSRGAVVKEWHFLLNLHLGHKIFYSQVTMAIKFSLIFRTLSDTLHNKSRSNPLHRITSFYRPSKLEILEMTWIDHTLIKNAFSCDLSISSVLLWQREASDKSPKSEILMCLD